MKDEVLWNVQAPQRAPSEEQWELEKGKKTKGNNYRQISSKANSSVRSKWPVEVGINIY